MPRLQSDGANRKRRPCRKKIRGRYTLEMAFSKGCGPKGAPFSIAGCENLLVIGLSSEI
jgi:hypothetical protein